MDGNKTFILHKNAILEAIYLSAFWGKTSVTVASWSLSELKA